MMLFGLAFVVEVVVGYNSFMHKTQPQKLIFLVFCGFFSGSHIQPQLPPQIQTHNLPNVASVMAPRDKYFFYLPKALFFLAINHLSFFMCF